MSIHIRTVHITTAGLIDYPFIGLVAQKDRIYASDENEPNLSAIPQGIRRENYRRNQSIYNCWRFYGKEVFVPYAESR